MDHARAANPRQMLTKQSETDANATTYLTNAHKSIGKQMPMQPKIRQMLMQAIV